MHRSLAGAIVLLYLITTTYLRNTTTMVSKSVQAPQIISSLCCLIFLLVITSCNQQTEEYYSVDDYPSVKKIDTHVHIRTERDAFAKQAEKDNFQLVNIVVDGAGTWEAIRDQFRFCKFQQQAHGDRYRVITSFSVEDFHDANWEEKVLQWLDSCFNQGAIGIKVWKNIGMVLKDTNDTNVMLNDDRLDGIFNYLEQEGKLVVGHLGEPYNCWLPLEEMTTNNDRGYFERNPQYHMYKHPELPSYQDQMNARNRRLDKHANLKFAGAHMASIEWNVDSLAAWFDRYPTATIDLAARMGQVFYQTQQYREKVRDFFIKYSERIMYATDMGDRGTSEEADLVSGMHETWMRDWEYFTTDDMMESDLVEGGFQGIQLPKKVVDDIFYGTAKRVFGF